MIRFFFILISLLLLAGGAAWLANHPGHITLQWLDYRIDTYVTVALFAVLLIFIALFIIVQLITMLLRSPFSFLRKRYQHKHHRGLGTLTEAYAALALSDGAKARQLANKAEHLLGGGQPLVLLLQAHLHRLDNNPKATETYLRKMLDHKETAPLAARDLLVISKEKGNFGKALDYADKAIAIAPQNPAIYRNVVDLHLRQSHWQEAERAIDSAVRHKALARAETDRLRAIVYYLHATAMQRGEQSEAALTLAQKSFKLSPQFIPAAPLYAEILLQRNAPDKAMKILRAAWAWQPHPLLGELFFALMKDKDKQTIMKAAEKLVKEERGHLESHLLMARAALMAEMWETAGNHIKSALGFATSRRACLLMAELEEKAYHAPEKAAEWLRKASNAAPEPQWVCKECHTTYALWQPVCHTCQSFDSLEWKDQPTQFHYVEMAKSKNDEEATPV